MTKFFSLELWPNYTNLNMENTQEYALLLVRLNVGIEVTLKMLVFNSFPKSKKDKF